ncbi:apolipoprotein A-II-like [Hyperolius riggenbachi]|uniref:apolipoprotein A-II-like n=1 Tax=Hyperolius riggenbachi TaxID=752182 RepID=UPI0035A27C56
MKVLALVVLVIVISSSEGFISLGIQVGVIEEIVLLDKFTKPFSDFGKSLRNYGTDVKEKFYKGELKSNTAKLITRVQELVEPIIAKTETWVQDFFDRLNCCY